MNYKELYIKTRDLNKNQTKLSSSTIFELFYRRISFFITPFFLLLRVSPNVISGLVLIMGLISSFLIFTSINSNISLGIVIFFFSIIVDYVDGNVARISNKSSFYGRFIDGLIDIIVLSAIRLALCRLILVRFESETTLLWVGLFCCILTPIHHFIYDRFSAISRWCNEENKTTIEPYIRQLSSPKIAFFLIDL